MVIKILVEILILWCLFAVYMAILVGGKGAIGGIQFYPEEVQKRAVELKLITEEQLKKQLHISMLLLVFLDTVILFIMIVVVNQAESYWECAWQWYVLFAGQELFDWFVVDVFWVTMTSWWIIPGTEDLLYLWHDPKIKFKGKLKVFPAAILVAALVGGVYYLISCLI